MATYANGDARLDSVPIGVPADSGDLEAHAGDGLPRPGDGTGAGVPDPGPACRTRARPDGDRGGRRVTATRIVASLMVAACREWLGPPDVRARFRDRPNRPRLVSYDSGIASDIGVLNWGDAVDGEADLWAVAEGRA